MKDFVVKLFAVAVLYSSLAGSGFATVGYNPPLLTEKAPSVKPAITKDIRIDQKLDSQVPLDVPFLDENGSTVTLGDYAGKKPIILNLVYFGCPMLCGQVLNGLTQSLKMLKSVPMVPGDDFEVVTISFDPRETPELAKKKKASFIKELGQPGAEKHWHWLTGKEKNIRAVTDAVGFHYVWDEKFQQYVHATGIFILTPKGRVSRYFFGATYSPKDMRLGLSEASGGKIGGPAERLLLLCFHYDPTQGKYSVMVFRLIQIGGLLILAALVSFVALMLRSDSKSARRKKKAQEVPSQLQP